MERDDAPIPTLFPLGHFTLSHFLLGLSSRGQILSTELVRRLIPKTGDDFPYSRTCVLDNLVMLVRRK